MARNKANQQNIDGSDLANYPNKRIRNNSGTGDGTPVNESVYGDFHEFFAKLMREAKINYNDLPDNVTNDYQLYNALVETANKNNYIKIASFSAPETINIPVRISALKTDESIIFKANFDSVDTISTIKGSDNILKNSLKLGNWKSGDYVRIINNAGNISITGLYDSQNVPNLVDTIKNITEKFTSWEKIMSVFIESGAMVFWNKPANEIPEGWREVVNWKGRIPVGMDVDQLEFATLGKEGGEKTTALTNNQLPKLQGQFWVTVASDQNISGALMSEVANNNAVVGGGASSNWRHKQNRISFGNDEKHNNLPPYRTVLFIEYIG